MTDTLNDRQTLPEGLYTDEYLEAHRAAEDAWQAHREAQRKADETWTAWREACRRMHAIPTERILL